MLRLKNLLHPFLRIGPQGNSADIAIDFCVGFGPKDEFMSVGMVKERFSCAKIDFEGKIYEVTKFCFLGEFIEIFIIYTVNFKNGTKQTGTWRTIIETGRCPQIEKGFGSVINLYAGFGSNGTIDCYECNQNYCNLASTTQGSFFTLLVVSVFVNFLKF